MKIVYYKLMKKLFNIDYIGYKRPYYFYTSDTITRRDEKFTDGIIRKSATGQVFVDGYLLTKSELPYILWYTCDSKDYFNDRYDASSG